MLMQVTCPGCKATLRVPAAWLHQPIQCKHCGIAVKLETRAGVRRAVAVRAERASPAEPQAGLPPPAVRGGRPQRTPRQLERRADRRRFLLIAALGGLFAIGLLVTGVFLVTRDTKNEVAQTPKPRPQPPSPERRPGFKELPWLRVAKDGEKPQGLPDISPEIYATIAAASRNARPNPEQNPPIEPADGFGNRRLLGVCISHPLYFTDVAYGPGEQSFRTLLDGMGKSLKFGQITELSDASPTRPIPPLKALIEKAITDLCRTSRPQDRIVLVVAGQALEVGGIPYLVPFDGTDEVSTLIPLAWIQEQLAQSKARQKTLVLDLGRLDPTRGRARPGSEPLGLATTQLLSQPPAGVQVWSACAADQQSYEDGRVGSIFLSTIQLALRQMPEQDPTQSIPIEELARFVNAQTGVFTAGIYEGKKQTPTLWGKEKVNGAVYDPQAKPAVKVAVDYIVPEAGVAGIAPKARVEEMLAELRTIPPLRRLPPGFKHLDIDTFPLFMEDRLAGYEPGLANTDLRMLIRAGVQVLARYNDDFREEFLGDVNNSKQQAGLIQRRLAIAQLEYQEMVGNLQEGGVGLAREKSKRWHALYHYVLARLLERKAYTYEYNNALAKLRSDTLPELKPDYAHRGWRLAARPGLTARGDDGRKAKDELKLARGILTKMIDDHKGTPYAVVAARALRNHIGLEWQPTR